MRILITGARGQLGSDLVKELGLRGIETVGIDIEDLDIRDRVATEDFLSDVHKKNHIDAIIHCAAYTAVDRAEDEPETVRAINAGGTENIALVCARYDIPMMYISTDYVFDGEGDTPWKPLDQRNPLNVYGQMKYEGELAVEKLLSKHFIVRISWVFGLKGNNFVKTMLKLGAEKDRLTVVDDQVGSPTYTPDLAKLLSDMIVTNKYGVYHASNEGYCSWYEFAREIFDIAGNNRVRVEPVNSEAFPVKARRPHNSRMDKSDLDRAGFKRMPSWQDATRRYIQLELGQ